jgi:hypothetical protein
MNMQHRSRPIAVAAALVLGAVVTFTSVIPEELTRLETARVAAAQQTAEATRTTSFAKARELVAEAQQRRPGSPAFPTRTVSVRLKDPSVRPTLAVAGHDLDVRPVFNLERGDRFDLKAALAAGARGTLSRLDSWIAVTVPDGTDPSALLAALEADDAVAEVFVPLEASLPRVADLQGYQGYRRAAPEGIGIAAAANVAGGKGENVRIIDIEYGWDAAHEDLERAAAGLIPVGTPITPHGMRDTNHGTAVLGQIVGTPNGFGVTGLAPKARMGMVNANSAEYGYQLAHAITVAVAHTQPGDVILLEQQFALTTGGTDYVPVEHDPTVFDAIVAAVNAGRIVIEAAGNGYQDLDALGIGRRDSGAIMVGAGQVDGCRGNGSSGDARSRADFSNYGSRVDVQGWGECVVTTGYGDLYQDGTHRSYTASFAGTSSASPIVASAAAILSSIVEQATGRAANPLGIRRVLRETGSPQAAGLRGNIGPMPNLAKAIPALGVNLDGGNGGGTGSAPEITAPKVAPAAGYRVQRDYDIPVTVTWSATDADGISRVALKVSKDGGAWTDVELPSATARSVTLALAVGHSYRFTVNARDRSGTWGAWQSGARFTPYYYADNSEYISYTGTWRRASWDPAEGGSVTVSGQAGAWASFSFTGRGIAWVASMGTTRGEADIWIDDTYMGRVDLGSQTSFSRVLAFTARVSSGVRHTLVIQAVGTSGRPKVDLDGIVILK